MGKVGVLAHVGVSGAVPDRDHPMGSGRAIVKLAISLSLALAAGLVSSPTLSAQEALSPRQAETRLRGCLQAGSAGAPRTGLHAAVVAVRALCKPQIDRVAEDRVAAATQGLTDEDAEQAGKRAFRQLNDEIAYAIANFTGLKTL